MEEYNDISDGNINISDIIEVIQTTDPGSMASMTMNSEQPHVKILEQPASKALRFRYECEGRSAGSIPGINSTPESKTFPSIRIVGYKGRAMVVVSCVTKDAPYRPHPHNLVGREVCKQGVCTVEVPAGNMIVTFSNLGIQCVKKKDIEDALRVREELRVDPFRTGFEHKKQTANIDLNAVRLCFQVFLEGSQKGKFNKPLPPIVSDPIYDKKAMSDLVICKLSHCSAPVAGSMEMILLCEKVAKEDIQVRFFEEKDGQLLWEGYGDFQPTHVHKQTAIAFRTPSYRTQQVELPVQIYIQLKRPSDGATSEPLPFQMLPLGTGRPAFWSLRKAFARKKADYSTFSKILATETALLSNVASPKFPRNIDEFNNNNLDLKRSNSKISALRALNDLYNVKNHVDHCNGDLKVIMNSAPNVTQTAKNTILDYENNEVTVMPERNMDSINKEINKLYTFGSTENGTFSPDYKDEIIDVVAPVKSDVQNDAFTLRDVDGSRIRSDWFDHSEIGKWMQKGQTCLKERDNETDLKSEREGGGKSFNEFLSQVAELDQIYADTHAKLEQAVTEPNVNNPQSMDVDVCDNQTYTSLQMAMKNPIELFDITDDRKYEDVAMPNQDPEAISVSPPLTTKRDVTREAEERLPPLPPKRIRKMPSMPLLPRPISAQTLGSCTTEAPNKNLPSLPDTLLTKHSKQGLFSKLFAKRIKRDKCSIPNLSRDSDSSSINTSYLLKNSVPDTAQLQLPRPSMTSVTSVKSLKLDGDETPPYSVDLTEAEHYALYTTMAPHATASEFDEMSFYYSLVEGGKILTEGKET